jgi:hypothetical protein
VKLLADGDALANHVSRNSTLHVYKETAEEVLITIFKTMAMTYKTSSDDTRLAATLRELVKIRGSSEKNARLQRVLHNDSLCMMLSTRLLKLGTHFRRRREFSVTWLAKAIGTCMGVSLFFILLEKYILFNAFTVIRVMDRHPMQYSKASWIQARIPILCDCPKAPR